jgi:hypothetical protein
MIDSKLQSHSIGTLDHILVELWINGVVLLNDQFSFEYDSGKVSNDTEKALHFYFWKFANYPPAGEDGIEDLWYKWCAKHNGTKSGRLFLKLRDQLDHVFKIGVLRGQWTADGTNISKLDEQIFW